ncbi:hypothetical protein F511_23403 [Dorcoceras hygrometricum]|uniref:Uncharacterized protein n=1 Tax=Dorcoceras hygrometricum TaxID=472368 RepID=A0A2Z7BM19_9LAMI|nr:hypothetical protein F511_23403 [Dorcoceras hygrometricum]
MCLAVVSTRPDSAAVARPARDHQLSTARPARDGGGRYRQSGPRPETGFLRQPALEGLTRSARTDSPRQDWPETIFRRIEAAAAAATETATACREERGGVFCA